MTITAFVEVYNSRAVHSATKAKESSTDIVYLLIGDEELGHYEAETYAKLHGPQLDQDLVRTHVDLNELRPGYFRAAFHFAHPDNEKAQDDQQPEDPSEFSFDTTGGSANIKVSLGTQPYPSDARNFKNAIGVSGDSVEGVDITVPAFKYTEKIVLPAATVTRSYVRALRRLTGKVNNNSFKGWEAGEVLFLGAVGTQRGRGGDWDITFHFDIELNETDLTIGEFEGIAKEGHQYLWAYFEPAHDEDANALVLQPTAVYVETVYRDDNFSDLLIGA